METVLKKKEQEEKLTVSYPYSMEDNDTVTFSVLGQNVERSIEDRSVYFNVNTNVKGTMESVLNMWFRGEDAIKLGLILIEQGNFALEANRINHQKIHSRNFLDKYVMEDKVSVITFECIDESPVNYGKGFKTFKITPTWKEGEAPKYTEDFSYEEVIYWSPFVNEFMNHMERFTRGKCAYEFVNYDHDERIKEFNNMTFDGACCSEEEVDD